MADSLLRVTVHNCKVNICLFLSFSHTHTCASTCVIDQNNHIPHRTALVYRTPSPMAKKGYGQQQIQFCSSPKHRLVFNWPLHASNSLTQPYYYRHTTTVIQELNNSKTFTLFVAYKPATLQLASQLGGVTGAQLQVFGSLSYDPPGKLSKFSTCAVQVVRAKMLNCTPVSHSVCQKLAAGGDTKQLHQKRSY